MGQRQIFVRFIGCDLRCGYCDTPETVKSTGHSQHPCRVQVSPHVFERENRENPFTPSRLTEVCARLTVDGQRHPVISLTGGEPLLHRNFLEEWLPLVAGKYRIYLETNGVQYEAMNALANHVDTVSMDIKLPSATGQAERWSDHRKFLEAARGGKLFVKAVVTKNTELEDLLAAVSLVAGLGQRIPFIIQPASGLQAPAAETLIRFQNRALGIIEDVRIVPQVHKVLLVP